MQKTMSIIAIIAATATGLSTSGSAQNARAIGTPAAAVATPDGGYRLGNPNARVRLVEYVSYTCSHCANYEAESHDALRRDFIARGTTSVEVRPLVRDIVDLAAATVARCGAAARFFDRHHALMTRQSDMIAAAQAAQASWAAVPQAERLARVAQDTGVIAAVLPLGVTRAQANACLADVATIRRTIAIGEGAGALGIEGTPSFLINGQLQQGAHSWTALRPRLDAALSAR